MRRIKSKNTKPELTVRRLLHRLGYRYRLHRKDLPGTPDLTFPKRKKVIFIHGCFWHQHQGSECKNANTPRTNSSYWIPKLERNIKRDEKQQIELVENGWEVFVVWECELNKNSGFEKELVNFLESE